MMTLIVQNEVIEHLHQPDRFKSRIFLLYKHGMGQEQCS